MKSNYIRIKLPCQEELVSGTFFDANAQALITKSLTDNLTPSFSSRLLNLERNFVIYEENMEKLVSFN